MYTFVYPGSLKTFETLEEAYSKGLAVAHSVNRAVIVYQLDAVRVIAPPSPVPPPAMPPRIA